VYIGGLVNAFVGETGNLENPTIRTAAPEMNSTIELKRKPVEIDFRVGRSSSLSWCFNRVYGSSIVTAEKI
jgi:hypothetical protein